MRTASIALTGSVASVCGCIGHLGAASEAERFEAKTSDRAAWAALRAGPIAFPTGSELIGAAGSDVVFRLRSGWVALSRTGPFAAGAPLVVGIATTGDLVGPDTMAAAGADAAMCLGPVSVAAATTAALQRSAAGDPALAAWIAQQVTNRRRWADCRLTPDAVGGGKARLAALLCHMLGCLASGGEAPETAILPLSLERIADLVAMDPAQFGDALQWLLDLRILRCVLPVADGVVIGIADRSSLCSLALQGTAPV